MIKKILLILTLLPINTYANYINYYCDKQDTYLVCQIDGYSKEEISAVHFKYEYNNLEVVNNEIVYFKGDSSDNVVDLYTDNNKKDKFNIMNIKFKVLKDNYTFNINDVLYYDKDFREIKINNVKNKKLYTYKNNINIYNIIKYVIILLIGITFIIVVTKGVKLYEKK